MSEDNVSIMQEKLQKKTRVRTGSDLKCHSLPLLKASPMPDGGAHTLNLSVLEVEAARSLSLQSGWSAQQVLKQLW